MTWVALAAIGGLGAIARFHVDGLVQRRTRGAFPFGTLTVNAVGTFVLGLLTGLGVGTTTSFELGTGLIGSFTTFSTWMLETQRLGEEGEERVALSNLALSLAAGLACGVLGWTVGAAL
jgi:fluoride exporter